MPDRIAWTNATRKLSDLVPWEHNPVTLSQRAAEGLQVSIDKFGFAQPLLVGPDGSLYDGHQRQKILDMMADYGPDAEVDVRVSSRPLTEAERQELAIRMRKNTGDFDFDILANEFEVDDLLEWGFEPFELEVWNEPPSLDELENEYGDPGERDFWPVIRVQVSPGTFEMYKSLMATIPGEDDSLKVEKLLGAVDATVLGGG